MGPHPSKIINISVSIIISLMKPDPLSELNEKSNANTRSLFNMSCDFRSKLNLLIIGFRLNLSIRSAQLDIKTHHSRNVNAAPQKAPHRKIDKLFSVMLLDYYVAFWCKIIPHDYVRKPF